MTLFKNTRFHKSNILLMLQLFLLLIISANAPLMAIEKYSSIQEVNKRIYQIQKSSSKFVKIQELTISPGKNPLLLMEIGTEVQSEQKSKPAILVTGNMEGKHLHGTEAALFLAEKLTKNQELLERFTWYILPLGNPDAAQRYFSPPLYVDSRNATPHNDDLDEQPDEDGFNDLDGNGFITKMRIQSPDGEWISLDSDPRLMRKADPTKGEQGMYKVYTEGIDDDGDGKYNEDGPGGTNVGVNFPHLFEYFGKESGLYPGSTPEVYALMEFVFAHREIAMNFTFGASNFCLIPPKGGQKGAVDLNNIKINERRAKQFDLDINKTYTIKELMEALKPFVPDNIDLTETLIASIFELGAVINFLEEDLKFYNTLSEDFKKYLKEKGVEDHRFDPESAKDGSFELWSYYQLGVPVFSMDLWGIPKSKEGKNGLTNESVEKMTPEEFVASDIKEIEDFLVSSGMPKEQKSETIIESVKNGKINPKQLVEMLKKWTKPKKDDSSGNEKEKALLAYADQHPNIPVFVDWKEYTHPQLGKVEIGGFIPYSDILPVPKILDSIFEINIPWIFELTKKLPDLKISDTKLTSKGNGIYQLEIWVENKAMISFPTAIGRRNNQPAPAIIILEGKNIEFINGYQRTRINTIQEMKSKKFSWIIQSNSPTTINIILESKSAGKDVKQIKIGG